jgi:hypothetical protein
MSLSTSDSSPTYARGLNDFCRATGLGRSNVSSMIGRSLHAAPGYAGIGDRLGWERFEADELSEVLKARGIIYRRRGNVHGFDGLRLKDEADDE